MLPRCGKRSRGHGDRHVSQHWTGEEVILTGCWVTHPTYGEQFATEAFERRLPTSVRGIAEYLGSGLIRGIGPRLAAKLRKSSVRTRLTFFARAGAPSELQRHYRPQGEGDRPSVHRTERNAPADGLLSEHGLPVALTPLLYKRLYDSAIDARENPHLLCDPY